MGFCGKVDNDLFAGQQRLLFSHQKLADGEGFVLAGLLVHLEIVRELIFELQCNTFAHHAHCIDGIDQCFRFAFQNISGYELYHGSKVCFVINMDLLVG